MDRLSIVLTFMTGSVLVGSLLIIVLSLGFYGWTPILAAVAVGLLLTWPSAYVISRWIKSADPGWQPKSGATDATDKPDTDFPET
ncbi:hypothetical protein [Yoonia sp.]|uniref:hypothetical protein n=1 Tax=Yoonia sp. TaxID=2212373 RepID=UPI003F6AF486